MRLVASDERALALGLVPGLALADARVRVPDLDIVAHDPEADRLWLERIADLSDRYSPRVMLDPPFGIVLDVAGCAHLFGGEAGMASDATARLNGLGLVVRHAFADAPEAAQALARFRPGPQPDEEAAIRSLPVAALRLDGDTERALRRAGLKTIGDLASRPRAPLRARFGDEMALRLAKLLGEVDSRIVPRHPAPAFVFGRSFAEPIGRIEDALAVIGDLAREAESTLEREALGGRRFSARLYRSDGTTRDLAVETGLPIRDPAILRRLFDERLTALSDPLDPGFGFDLVRLAIPLVEPLGARQLHLSPNAPTGDALSGLVDRLSTRLGRDSILRFVPADTHLPEREAVCRPAADHATAPTPATTPRTGSDPASWPVPSPGEPPLRPIHLFDPPQRIEALAEVPDGPPRRFRWRGTLHDVVRHEGPERIASPWWRRNGLAGLTRDYYRIEDGRGRRYWVFRHGLYGTETADPGWYLHGLFA